MWKRTSTFAASARFLVAFGGRSITGRGLLQLLARSAGSRAGCHQIVECGWGEDFGRGSDSSGLAWSLQSASPGCPARAQVSDSIESGSDDQAAASFEAKVHDLRTRMEISRILHEMPKPTLAVIPGAAAGAGSLLCSKVNGVSFALRESR